MFIRDTSIRASSAYRAFPPLFISFIRFSDFSHSTPFPFPLSNPTTTTLYYMLSNEPRKKKGEREEKKRNLEPLLKKCFFFLPSFSLSFHFLRVYSSFVSSFDGHQSCPSKILRRRHHSRAGCLRSAALRPSNDFPSKRK